MKKRWDKNIKKTLEENRLLIISPFEEKIKYVDNKKANIRNKLIFNLSDKIQIPYIRKGGFLEKLVNEFKNLKKIQIGF